MGNIKEMLGLRKDATEKEVRSRYMKQLFAVHPHVKGGSEEKYMMLKTAYERYCAGDVKENPYAVCRKEEAASMECRCGGRYSMSYEMSGRMECECCSCFIDLLEDPMELK